MSRQSKQLKSINRPTGGGWRRGGGRERDGLVEKPAQSPAPLRVGTSRTRGAFNRAEETSAVPLKDSKRSIKSSIGRVLQSVPRVSGGINNRDQEWSRLDLCASPAQQTLPTIYYQSHPPPIQPPRRRSLSQLTTAFLKVWRHVDNNYRQDALIILPFPRHCRRSFGNRTNGRTEAPRGFQRRERSKTL